MSSTASISLDTLSQGTDGRGSQMQRQTLNRTNSGPNLGGGSNMNVSSSKTAAAADPGLVSSASPVLLPSTSQPNTPPRTRTPNSTPASADISTLSPDPSGQVTSQREGQEAWYRKAWTFIDSFLNFTNVAIIIALGIIGILAYKHQTYSQMLAVWNAKKDFQGSCLARKEAGELLSSECYKALEPDYLGEPPGKRDFLWPIAKISPLGPARANQACGALCGIVSTKALRGLLNVLAGVIILGFFGIAATCELILAFQTQSKTWDAVSPLSFLALFYLPLLPVCGTYPLLNRFLFGPTTIVERFLAMLGVSILSENLHNAKLQGLGDQWEQAPASFLRFYHRHRPYIEYAKLFFFFYASGVCGLLFLWVIGSATAAVMNKIARF